LGFTERLYYTDSYLRSFTAKPVRVENGGCRIYLDRSGFYPASGGQPHDLGSIGHHRVIDVVDEGDDVAHVLATPLDSAETVACEIDWPRRWDHMQQHTAQHLLSAVWVEKFGIETVSFHMGEQVSSIELDARELRADQILAVEERINELCWESRPVAVAFEDAENVTGLRKSSGRSGALRIVSIAGLDRSACGGTHVRSTAELAPIGMRALEKIRGRVRVEFIAGGRCIRRNRSDYEVLATASREAGCTFEALSSTVTRLRERTAVAEKELARLAKEAARSEGLRLYAETAPAPDGVRRLQVEQNIDELAKSKIQAFASGARAVAMVISRANSSVLLGVSPDTGIDCGAVVKAALSRGGGSRGMAQGTFSAAEQIENLCRALGFVSAAE
jgi:alanyl-tRNA synthetase